MATVGVPVNDPDRAKFGAGFGDRAAERGRVAGVGRIGGRGDARAFKASTPTVSRGWLRATSATENPSPPNFSAIAVETPGPNPTTTMVFDMANPAPDLFAAAIEFSTAASKRLYLTSGDLIKNIRLDLLDDGIVDI